MTSPQRAPLKPFSEALAQLLALAAPLAQQEALATFEADGRVLAQDIRSDLQVPPQDNSAMDGYAVRCGDVVAANTVLPVSQRIAAGDAAHNLAPHSVARIFTGASVPSGADAIVMQEDCTLDAAADPLTNTPAQLRIHSIPQPGQWIRRAGEDVAQGDLVLAAGCRLGPAELGLAASVGMATLQVVRRPRVALFSTGDELVMPGSVPPSAMPPGAIYNSNRFFLSAMLRRLGCTVSDLGIVPDQRGATIEALRTAAQSHDLILTSGGVSVGEEDHIKPAVQALGQLDLWQIAIKPGKPFAYGRVGQAHFMGLPGNPVSSFVTFLLLVRPFLLRLQGVANVVVQPTLLRADFDWPRADKRQEFLRVRRNAQGGLDLFPNQSSGVLTSAVWADGLVDTPAGCPIVRGEMVRFIALQELLS